MDYGRLLSRSWEGFIRQPVNMLLFYLVGTLLMIVPILNLVIMGGIVKGMIKASRGEDISINDLFSEMDRAGEWIIGGLLGAIAVVIASVFFLIPGIIVAFLISMYPYLMADKRLGFMDAFKESFAITSKNIVPWLIVMVIMALINAIGSAVVIGFLITGPISFLLASFAYQELVGVQATVYTGAPGYDPSQTPPPPPPQEG